MAYQGASYIRGFTVHAVSLNKNGEEKTTYELDAHLDAEIKPSLKQNHSQNKSSLHIKFA